MPDFSYEETHGAGLGRRVVGVDEAGRGPWAGPVVAAAVHLTPALLPPEIVDRLDDSKRLTAASREQLAAVIWAKTEVGLGEASVTEIDELNILQASLLAMRRAVEALPIRPDVALVDGNRAPLLNCLAVPIIKGDGLSLSIAAASIIAKVNRDRRMTTLAAENPGYGWERNRGYGTREHREGLARLGVSAHHRRSFAPIRLRLEDN